MKKLLSILLLLFSLTPSVSAQKTMNDSVLNKSDVLLIGDTTTVNNSDDAIWHPIPKKATMLSAAIPGAGQIYNRQWWKVPILYAGLGTLGYFIYWNNDSYVRYRNAYIDFVDDDPTTNRYEKITPDNYVIEDDAWFKRTVENRRDSYRRDRDFLIICMVGVYALNIIEANVAAHLYDFDVSDDLSMNIAPELDYDFIADKPMVGLSLKLNINK